MDVGSADDAPTDAVDLVCSIKPMTGFYRDGCCNTGREDVGSHTICAVMTSAFLEFSKISWQRSFDTSSRIRLSRLEPR